jgi:hypothetical protein
MWVISEWIHVVYAQAAPVYSTPNDWITFISILGGLVSAGAAAWVLIGNNRHKNRLEEEKSRQEAEKTAIDQWKELHEVQGEQLSRQEKHIANQDRLILELLESDGECQTQLAYLYGFLERTHDMLVRCWAIMKKHGEDIGPLPELPQRPVRRQISRFRAEFMARQAAQDSATLAEISEGIKSKPTPE